MSYEEIQVFSKYHIGAYVTIANDQNRYIVFGFKSMYLKDENKFDYFLEIGIARSGYIDHHGFVNIKNATLV